MRTRIKVGGPVEDFLGSLAPAPRRAVRRGLKGLETGRGEVKLLEGRLAGYSRLRVGRVRVIFKAEAVAGERVVFCVYANYRNVVYELFQQLLISGLVEQVKRTEGEG